MATKQAHPFVTLRRAIRQSGTQYRKNDDNSSSLFHPDQGFIYAYQISAIEAALDVYELSLPNEFREQKAPETLQEQVMAMGNAISQEHESMQARDFARTVLAYMASLKEDAARHDQVMKLLANLGRDPDLGDSNVN
jgi:hypothetical protein